MITTQKVSDAWSTRREPSWSSLTRYQDVINKMVDNFVAVGDLPKWYCQRPPTTATRTFTLEGHASSAEVLELFFGSDYEQYLDSINNGK